MPAMLANLSMASPRRPNFLDNIHKKGKRRLSWIYDVARVVTDSYW